KARSPVPKAQLWVGEQLRREAAVSLYPDKTKKMPYGVFFVYLLSILLFYLRQMHQIGNVKKVQNVKSSTYALY
ncbi:MAG: hypothetical protein IKJ68_06280, partial [Clostridia bacterium]|nr:hypothetical protein [Clostridia bacterium]